LFSFLLLLFEQWPHSAVTRFAKLVPQCSNRQWWVLENLLRNFTPVDGQSPHRLRANNAWRANSGRAPG
jgi:hypothetical protein